MLAGAGNGAAADLCGVVTPIRFAPHSTSAVVHGAVARGEIACWSLAAVAGQHASLVIVSVEGNAVFQFYRPGWRLERAADEVTVDGHAYPGAAEGDDARAWSGRLTASGDGLVVVGSIRGGASYRLRVSVVSPGR